MQINNVIRTRVRDSDPVSQTRLVLTSRVGESET